jgi:hypothetical protein
MILTLQRTDYLSVGIFGTLSNEDSTLFLATAEHAYPVQPADATSLSTTYSPKVPSGQYTCILGQHQLSRGVPFDAYCLQDVPGCTGILLHVGNYPQTDSEGCILLGLSRVGFMIQRSQDAFKLFMTTMAGQPFQLIIS